MRTTFKSSITFAAMLVFSQLLAAQAGGTPSSAPDTTLSTDKSGTPKSPVDFFGQSIAGHWVFSADLGFDQEYDDNVFSSSLVRLSDNISRINARFSASVQKKRLRMQVHYYPNYASYSKYSDRNALSHQYVQDISYRWSGHTDLNWSLTASRAPGYTNSPFTLVDFGENTFLPVFRPDALQSDATITNASTSVDWSHRFSAQQTLKIDLQSSAVEFSTDNGVPLSAAASRKTFSNGASVRWEDEFVPRKTLGLEFGEQYFGFLEPSSHSHYQFVKLRYSQSFGKSYRFSLGAGPSRNERQLSSVLAGSEPNKIDYALDVSLTKTGARQSIGLSYNHGSQLGLTQGSLASDGVALSYVKQLGRKWSVNSAFGYSRSQTETTALIATASSYSVDGGVQYQLLPQMTLNAGYSYVSQDFVQSTAFSNSFDRNVFRVGLNYRLQKITSR